MEHPLLPVHDLLVGLVGAERGHLPREGDALRDRQVRVGELVGLAEDHRPGEEERHLHVEDDEQQGDDVEAQVELHPGAADGRLAALVDGRLLGVHLGGAEHLAQGQVEQDETDAGAGEQEQISD